MLIKIGSLLIGVLFAVSIIVVRMKASNRPTNAKKILLPPVFMSTGFLMFVVPEVRVPWSELIEAFLVGVLFSIFLIKTSKFHVKNDEIYLKRSKAFIFILIGLLVIRTVMKIYLEKSINLPQTSGLFFTLAFGMILPWRIAMYVMYRRLVRRMEIGDVPTTT
ncbi:membrane protein CcdC involved in cytochrome C biogenesis [Scopulibacillus darangshiensis]|uniref:Membrane protein CcdC involved in cytochrome C biogenesis n=1 Tax=Scopulibacillus darangshiensis TaxID=442528 RepID=A0A4R2P8P8_9BACL|nr:cytochrome c biogenesis protein CcdC [Scopulibacillus darangshiensis]TCP30225.1 membrane protein CcdC involved in cytochrome C biogenesis [Scopulibacillus darangshiensis]